MEEQFIKLEVDQKWRELFEFLGEKSGVHPSNVGSDVANNDLNRYPDVLPYDRSRVKLTRLDDTDYINANLVTVPKAARQYILTQGPLLRTLGHFWLMVWEQKSNFIVMLNRLQEMEEYAKCEQYWPNSINDTDHYADERLAVTLKSVKEHKHYTIREMTLQDETTQKSRSVTQFHYKAWPDYGQPESPTSFLRLLSAIRKSGGLDKMDEPTIVHCSAGIGRSGTFCLIDSVLSMIENQGSTEGIDIISTLLEMREYRKGLIQSEVQLRFAYMSIIYGVKILQKANKLHPHISSIKDSVTNDASSGATRQENGPDNTNGKSTRRNRRKKQNSSSNSRTLNVFQKHLLVEALDDIDSDSADSLFYDLTKPWPNIKKARSSYSDDATQGDQNDSISDLTANQRSSNQQAIATTKAELLTNAINSLRTEKISTNNVSPANPSSVSSSTSQATDSALLRRREERELRNQRLAEKTMTIKDRMKAEDLKRETNARRLAFLKRSAVYGGVAALVVSSVVYMYLHGNASA